MLHDLHISRKKMTAAARLKVVESPNRDDQDLKRIRDSAIEQLGKAGIHGAVITDDDAKEISDKLSGFISETLKSYGLTVPTLDIDIKPNQVKINAAGATVGTTGIDIYHQTYLEHSDLLGLRPEWLGSSFILSGKNDVNATILTVTGLEFIGDNPALRFQRISNGTRSVTRTAVSPTLVKDVGIAIDKYRRAFSL